MRRKRLCGTNSSLISVQGGATALYLAAQNGYLRTVELLIAAKALIDFAHIAVSIVFSKALINYLNFMYRMGGQHCM